MLSVNISVIPPVEESTHIVLTHERCKSEEGRNPTSLCCLRSKWELEQDIVDNEGIDQANDDINYSFVP